MFPANCIKNAWMRVMLVQLNVRSTIIQHAKNVQKLVVNVRMLVISQLNADLMDFKKVAGRENSSVAFLLLVNNNLTLKNTNK